RLTFKSKGQKLLGVVWYPTDTEKPPAVLVLHGFPGIEKNYDLAYALCQRGFASMIFHYRGCWGSSGKYSFLGCFEDAKRAIEELMSRENIREGNLAIVGHSFGGLVAIYLSAHIKRVKATVAMSPLANIKENVSIRERKIIFRGGLPFVKDLSLRRAMDEFETIEKTYDPVTYVDKLSPSPLLLVHGNDDEIVPVKCSVDLYKDALPPKNLLVVRRADHIFSGRRRYVVNRVANWIRSKIL
ncbi:alpha/beta fold hydrolase, partial [Candidatus Bathyarchaeota archaeon]|nr:alpha/beta fold hydrolase [Candidatus Bathyarchaeota archaeon]